MVKCQWCRKGSDDKSEVYGRPVGVAVVADGSLLMADDGGNIIWKVSNKK